MPTGMPASGRQRIALGRQRVHARGLLERALFGQAQIDIQPRIDLRDAFVVAGGQIGGLGAARGDFGAQSGQSLRLLNKRFRCFDFAGQSNLPYRNFHGFLRGIFSSAPTAQSLWAL